MSRTTKEFVDSIRTKHAGRQLTNWPINQFRVNIFSLLYQWGSIVAVAVN